MSAPEQLTEEGRRLAREAVQRMERGEFDDEALARAVQDASGSSPTRYP